MLQKLEKFHIKDIVCMSHCGPDDSLSRQYVSLLISKIHVILTDSDQIMSAVALWWTFNPLCQTSLEQGSHAAT